MPSNNYSTQRLPESNSSPSTSTIPGKEDWKRELVNGSHWHMIKGLKPGTSYKVRVVARDPADPTVHSTDEVLVAVPGEAACLRIDGLCVSFLSHFSHPFSVTALSHYQTYNTTFRHECKVVSFLVWCTSMLEVAINSRSDACHLKSSLRGPLFYCLVFFFCVYSA